MQAICSEIDGKKNIEKDQELRCLAPDPARLHRATCAPTHMRARTHTHVCRYRQTRMELEQANDTAIAE